MEEVNRSIENTSDGIIVINARKGIEYVNPSFSKITGIHVETGMRCAEIMRQTKGNNDFLRAVLACVYQDRRVHSSIQYTQEDGGISYLKLAGESCDADSYVLTVTDVTQLKEDAMKQKTVSHIIASFLVLITVWIFWVTIWQDFMNHDVVKSSMLTYSFLCLALSALPICIRPVP